MNRSTLRVFAAAAALLLSLAGIGVAQPNCGVLGGTSQTPLPGSSGTLPGSGDMSLGGGSTYLYVLTQWGFARASLSNPANPGPYVKVNIGNYHGNGGVIPILCDCHQGSNTMDVAQDPSGTARMISDWQPFKQDSGGSGLAAQVAMASSGGNPSFGQQIDLGPNTSSAVPLGGRVAAIYLSTTGKYFGYFPTEDFGVKMADITSPTGSTNPNAAIQPTNAIGWSSGVKLFAKRVTIPGYDKFLLVGTTGDLKLHVAEINTATGLPTEVASGNLVSLPSQIDVAVVNNRIFIFSAEYTGLAAYEFVPGPGIVVNAGSIAGNFKRVAVRGPAPFPALIGHRSVSGSESWIDIYDTKWLTEGGSPLLAKSLRHFGAAGVAYRGQGFESLVVQNGSVLTAYVYREVTTTPESSIHTDTVDISCIAADPTAPPIPFATMVNLSAALRLSPENTKNYFGDKWQIADASVSYLPITQLEWDFHFTGAFGAEKIANPPGSYANFAGYWPCDLLNGGEIFGGGGCYQSLGPITTNYQLGLRSKNANPPDTQTYVSPLYALGQPQIAIIGFDGTTLSVLAGNPNNGDASGSQGNVAEATFNWTFTPSGSATGAIVTVPSNATAFSLNAAYKGGYSTSKNGAILQVDLVPNFSITPNPVLKSSALTVKNLMQKAAAATLTSVTYSINSNPPLSGTLAGSFLPVNGTATVTSPAAVGVYSMTLTYYYTDHLGVPRTAPISLPFSVTDWAPNPIIGVYTSASHTGFVPPTGNPLTYRLNLGTTYYLFDDEVLPGGITHPGASFFKSSNGNASTSGDTLIGSSSGYGPVTLSASTACSSSCYLKAEVAGAVGVFAYTVTGGPPPPPPPPPPGSPALTLTGPSTANVGVAVVFTAIATNFPGTVSYGWDFGDGTGGDGGGGGGGGGECPPIVPNCSGLQIVEALVPGPATNSHTYTSAGTFTVTVQASSGSTVKTDTHTITIGTGGPPPPISTFNILGATFNPLNNTWYVDGNVPVTFSGSEPDPAAQFEWDFGDGSAHVLTRDATHAFTSGGLKTVTLTIKGGGTITSGTSIGTARFQVDAPIFKAIMIPGAGSIESPSGNWATDISVTNPGTQPTTVTLYFAAFTDAIPADLSTLPFDSLNSFLLEPGQSWSGIDVVGNPAILNRLGAGKGLLLLKYSVGSEPPIVTARVYFTSAGSSFGTALPSYLVGPYGQQTGLQDTEALSDQVLVGLRNDSLYRFNVSLFNASSQGGLFHLDAFTEQGEQVASRDFEVPAYSQAGVNDTDLFTPDAAKRYILKVSSSTGALQAFASSLDRRNNDLVQVADDTPRVAAAPGETVDYFISGVGRIEDAASNTHWRTDLRFFNSSAFASTLILEFHYMPVGATIEKTVLASLQLAAGQGVSIDDFVGSYLNQYADEDLTVGNVLGMLKVSYQAPSDVASAPMIIGGRIYADLSTGSAGMQLSTYSTAQTVAAGVGSLVMPGAQTNLRFRTNIGLFAAGNLPTTARITAVRQDGSVASVFDYVLNNPGQSGAFAQVPMTALAEIDGNPMTMRVESLSGSPVGAYIVTVDQISADTVFIQGKRN